MALLQESREQQIRKSAYRLWVQAGRPQGKEEEFRNLAKAGFEFEPQVRNDDLDMAGKHSFPASDPVNHT